MPAGYSSTLRVPTSPRHHGPYARPHGRRYADPGPAARCCDRCDPPNVRGRLRPPSGRKSSCGWTATDGFASRSSTAERGSIHPLPFAQPRTILDWLSPRRPPSVSVGCRPEGRLHDRLVRSRLGDEPPAAVILVPVGRASLPCCCGAVSHNWPHAVRRHAERRKTQPHPAPMMWEVSDRISNLTLTRPRTAQPGGWHRG